MKMKLLLPAALLGLAISAPTAIDGKTNITYVGIERNGIDVFLGIPYAQDTSGANRFKPPQSLVAEPGSTVDATKAGLPCPQQLGQWNAPLTLLNVTEFSENCLSLNIAKPRGQEAVPGGLPVLVWIHGGSFWVGSNTEPTHMPDGFIQESVASGTPVIHVAINYRLGFFGFSQSAALRSEKSENAGLRDQRAAIEWVRDHIHAFGGNGNSITIAGQSSGGLAVGMQLLAYGGKKPLPYQRGIAQSQALEPGLLSAPNGGPSFTQEAFARVVDHIGCRVTGDYDSQEVIECLRSKDTQSLFNSSFATYLSDISHNIGDIWLPSIDGDFLPEAPSELLKKGKFGKATYMLGWTNDDTNFFTDVNIATEDQAKEFIHKYVPGITFPGATLDLVDMYNVSDFAPPPSKNTNLTAEFYLAGRVFRDILMVCEPLYYAEALHRYDNKVYLYNWNQTILDPIIASVYNVSGMGVIHTSEFAYIWGNLSTYNVSGYPFNPTDEDYNLMHRMSRTWSKFVSSGVVNDGPIFLNASVGVESGTGQAPQAWMHAFWDGSDPLSPTNSPGYAHVYTVGGANEGFFPIDGPDAPEVWRKQKLVQKCGYLNTPSVVRQLGF
ncbi:alpha/beta-hydrolase [Periconia macrospinosa]|uniref:Carboxylic ester hydrolase n=1 Tax=Periconia macrospinosa TaxID=97972 RepID=A0A2V1E3W8_9PLEO|nr:alpha/beta-hydrolase [Periconia macrospinosa]